MVYGRVCLGVRIGGGQFTVVELGGGVGGWIRVWVVSEVLVGVSVRGDMWR